MPFFRSFYINNYFFRYLAVLVGGFILSYLWPPLYPIVWLLTCVLAGLFCFDLYLLYGWVDKAIMAKRSLPKRLSNSDQNRVEITYQSRYKFTTHITIIDELPVQFQKRDFEHHSIIKTPEEQRFEYLIRPLDRGEYFFGNLIVFASSPLRLVKRKFTFQNDKMVPVYPSIIQMQQYDFKALNNRMTDKGLKKIRRIGHSQEFEQIKEYVPGDDIRKVNWKATAKQNTLMVNQFGQERSQPIYAIIDTGRVMKMPFNGLKLVDYAINTSLAFSNVALKRKDKVGLITFSKNIETFVPAVQKSKHLGVLLEKLYSIDTNFTDSDYGMLYASVKRNLNQRSLLLLHTNFEHISALQRQLPYLVALAKKHVLVVIFFKNTTLDTLIATRSDDLQTIYHKTIAEKFSNDKVIMQKELRHHGIRSVLTTPASLTINTINIYLDIKARGLL